MVVVIMVNDEHRKRSDLRQRVNRAQSSVAGLLIAFVTAACSSGSTSGRPGDPTSSGDTKFSPAIGPDIAQPTLDPESPYKTTPGEFALQLKACLGDNGFDVEIDPYDFRLSGNVGDEDRVKALQAAVTECRALIDPSRNDPPPPLTEEQLRALYRYRVAESDCLLAAGYPASSKPPERVFIDSGGQWDARWGLEDVDIPQSVTRACEQVEGRPNFLDW